MNVTRKIAQVALVSSMALCSCTMRPKADLLGTQSPVSHPTHRGSNTLDKLKASPHPTASKSRSFTLMSHEPQAKPLQSVMKSSFNNEMIAEAKPSPKAQITDQLRLSASEQQVPDSQTASEADPSNIDHELAKDTEQGAQVPSTSNTNQDSAHGLGTASAPHDMQVSPTQQDSLESDSLPQNKLALDQKPSEPMKEKAAQIPQHALDPAEFTLSIQGGVLSPAVSEGSPLTEEQLINCQNYFQQQGNLVFYESASNLNLGARDILALSVVGNGPNVTVSLAPKNPSEPIIAVRGICLFLSGTQSQAQLDLAGMALDGLWSEVSNSRMDIAIIVAEPSSLGQADLKSHDELSSLTISRAPSYSCPQSLEDKYCVL